MEIKRLTERYEAQATGLGCELEVVPGVRQTSRTTFPTALLRPSVLR